MVARLWRRIQILTNLSILVWVNFLNTLSRRVHNRLLSLVSPVVPDVEADIGLLASGYQVMRERLRDSLQEIEQKTKQLEQSRDQLAKSRDFLQTTIDSLDDELMVLDSQLRITQANRRLYLNHKGAEIIGRYCYEVTHQLNHPCRPPSCVCPVDKVWRTGMPARVVHVHHASEGVAAERYIEVSASPLRDGTGDITQVVELTRDITESKELEKRILEANRQLLVLNEIASTVSQSLSLDVILNSALDKAMEQVKAESGGILLLDEKSKTLSYRVHRGLSDRYVQGVAKLALGEGIAGLSAQQGETLVVGDMSQDSRVSRRVAVAEEGIKAFVAVPLKSKEKIVGVLNITSQEARRFSQQEVDLLTAMGNQLGIAIENAELYRELQLKEQTRAELLRRIISAQEDERRRVARELHDVTSQALATLGVRLEAFAAAGGSNGKDAGTLLEEMKSLLTATSKEVHELIYDLRPSLLDDLGLPAALRSCARNSLEAAGIEVHLEVAGQEKRLPPQVEIAVFRIVQEAITNIASHAHAQSAYISLEFKEKGVAVQIEDDGIGFDLSQVLQLASVKESVGLRGMEERAELLGGTLSIDTKPGGGTRVTVEIPIDGG